MSLKIIFSEHLFCPSLQIGLIKAEKRVAIHQVCIDAFTVNCRAEKLLFISLSTLICFDESSVLVIKPVILYNLSKPSDHIRIIFVRMCLIIGDFESHHEVKVSQVHGVVGQHELTFYRIYLGDKILLIPHAYCFARPKCQRKRHHNDCEKCTDPGADFCLTFEVEAWHIFGEHVDSGQFHFLF